MEILSIQDLKWISQKIGFKIGYKRCYNVVKVRFHIVSNMMKSFIFIFIYRIIEIIFSQFYSLIALITMKNDMLIHQLQTNFIVVTFQSPIFYSLIFDTEFEWD